LIHGRIEFDIVGCESFAGYRKKDSGAWEEREGLGAGVMGGEEDDECVDLFSSRYSVSIPFNS
jgi:hypothetical protein